MFQSVSERGVTIGQLDSEEIESRIACGFWNFGIIYGFCLMDEYFK